MWKLVSLLVSYCWDSGGAKKASVVRNGIVVTRPMLAVRQLERISLEVRWLEVSR